MEITITGEPQMTDWQAIKPPIHATPVVPTSLILAGLLLAVWVLGYFVWDHWQFATAHQSARWHTDSVVTHDNANFSATMANGEAIDFQKAFSHQQCVLLYTQHADTATVNVLQLCRNSVNVKANTPLK